MASRKRDEIFIAALRIAASAPIKPSTTYGTAYIPWKLIIQLRELFEARGVDWKHIHRLIAKEKEEARANIDVGENRD